MYELAWYKVRSVSSGSCRTEPVEGKKMRAYLLHIDFSDQMTQFYSNSFVSVSFHDSRLLDAQKKNGKSLTNSKALQSKIMTFLSNPLSPPLRLGIILLSRIRSLHEPPHSIPQFRTQHFDPLPLLFITLPLFFISFLFLFWSEFWGFPGEVRFGVSFFRIFRAGGNGGLSTSYCGRRFGGRDGSGTGCCG